MLFRSLTWKSGISRQSLLLAASLFKIEECLPCMTFNIYASKFCPEICTIFVNLYAKRLPCFLCFQQAIQINLPGCSLTHQFSRHKHQLALSPLVISSHKRRHSLAGTIRSLVLVFSLEFGLVQFSSSRYIVFSANGHDFSGRIEGLTLFACVFCTEIVPA